MDGINKTQQNKQNKLKSNQKTSDLDHVSYQSVVETTTVRGNFSEYARTVCKGKREMRVQYTYTPLTLDIHQHLYRRNATATEHGFKYVV